MSKIENSGQGLKYKTLIIIVSIVIPVVVLILFNIFETPNCKNILQCVQ